jgi:hypothetical protein
MDGPQARTKLAVHESVRGRRPQVDDPVPLTGESQSVFGHNLQRAGDRMLLVWHDTRTGRDRLYAVTSTDAGLRGRRRRAWIICPRAPRWPPPRPRCC